MLGDYLRRLRDLVDRVKSALEERGEYVIRIVEVIELTVERGRGQGYLIFK